MAGPTVAVARAVTDELDSLRDRAEVIAREAGALLMSAFRSPLAVRSKRTSSDLVTELDERCEALLRDRLVAAFPGTSIVGEEAGGEGSEAGPVWYVDPIDGTSNFAHGHPYFCISLGLWEGASPVCGVVHAPAMALTYAAARGRGVTRNGERCRVSAVDSLEGALLGSGFPADRATRPDAYRGFMDLDRRSHGVRRCGAAALELSLVADGAYDGFFEASLMPWDLAAAVLFVTEAGGTVTDREGRPFRLDGREVVASNGHVHEALLLALAHAGALPTVAPLR